MKRILLNGCLMAVMLYFSSCSKNDELSFFWQESYVRSIILPPQTDGNVDEEHANKFIRDYSEGTGYFIPEDSPAIEGYVAFSMRALSTDAFVQYDSGSTADKKFVLDFARKYNDTWYRERSCTPQGVGCHCHSVVGEEVQGIKVITLDDFDSAHLAGSSINDITSLDWLSSYDLIQRAYYTGNEISIENVLKGNGWLGGDWCQTRWTFLKRHAPITTVSFPIPLFMPNFGIKVEGRPANPGTYRFRLEMELENSIQINRFELTWS